jgi:hypothetical protein
MPSKGYLMLRSVRRARLEARTASMQPTFVVFGNSFTAAFPGMTHQSDNGLDP